jgi:transposase
VFVKITRSGPRRYLQIVEAYRDPGSGRPKQRHIANLGRLEKLTETDLDGIIDGLLRATERPSLRALSAGVNSENTRFAPALELGDVWAVTQIWQQLKFAQTIARAVRGRRRIDVEQLVRVMVINRLSDPRSKLGVLRWLETVYLPGIDRAQVTHQNLLRAMDALIEHKAALEAQLVGTLLPLFDDELEVLFYDITTVGVEGEAELEGDLRAYGKAKAHAGTERQFAVGVVQTAEGLPITHEVFEGNVSEPETVKGIVEGLRARFPLRRLIMVADRGMLTEANLELLESLELADGQPVEYIVAVPARRDTKMTAALGTLHPKLVKESRRTGEHSLTETPGEEGRRLIVAHDPDTAAQVRRHRREKLQGLCALAEALTTKLEAQDAGERTRGRALSDHGAKLKFHQAVADAHLSRIIQVDANAALFSWSFNPKAFREAWQRDGKLVLITNVKAEVLDTQGVLNRYRDLADIERGFRVLKSEIEIAPCYHRLPDRIRAHTFICFLALVIHRVMRLRLRANRPDLTPFALLEQLKRIQYHEVRLATGKQLTGPTTLSDEQRALFAAIEVPVPTRGQLKAAA